MAWSSTSSLNSAQVAVAIDGAFSRSSRTDLKWNEALRSNELGNFLIDEAIKYGSRRNLIGSSLLCSVAGLLGPATSLDPVLTKEPTMPSVFLLAVAPPGAGKSPAIHKFTIEPIQRIANEFKQHIISGDFTKAGLCKVLSESKGYLLLAADECATALKTQLSQTTGEGSMRNLLNMLWDSRGYNKDFGTKDRVFFEKSYFTLFGTTHPDTLVSLLSTFETVNDGLRDRFLVIVAHIRRDVPHGERVFEAPDDWQYLMLRDLYRAHHQKIPQTNEYRQMRYHLSADATTHVKSIAHDEDEERDQQWADFDNRVDTEGTSSLTIDDRPSSGGSSKELQMALRLSVILHVLRSYLEQVRSGTYTGNQPHTIRHVPQNEITKDTLVEAIKFVERVGRMQQEFLTVSREMASPNPSPMKKRANITNSIRDILLFQGKYVTSTMLLRKLRKANAGAVIAAMSDMSKDPGTAGYLGVYMAIQRGRGGSKVHVFYKSPPDIVDVAKLTELNIDPAEYTAAYNDELTEPPQSFRTGGQTWAQYEQFINSRKPKLR